jgi:hypothetical protein
MKKRLGTLVLGFMLAICFLGYSASAQDSNRNAPVKGQMKQSGKEAAKAGTSLGHNVKHGRVVHGGKRFGQHVYRSGKHFGKGSKAAAKKTGRAVKKAVKP